MGKPWKELGRYGGVGIELVLAILILSAAGHWLDERYFGRRGWGMAVGFGLGVAVGVRDLIRVGRRMQKDIERAEAGDPEAGRWTVDESWLHKEHQTPSGRDASPDEGNGGRPHAGRKNPNDLAN
jgi:Putative F0F1-ATPase subunit Ca2+/Mg2+ transporter